MKLENDAVSFVSIVLNITLIQILIKEFINVVLYIAKLSLARHLIHLNFVLQFTKELISSELVSVWLLLFSGFALMCSVHKEPISRGTAMVISFSGAVTGLVGKHSKHR